MTTVRQYVREASGFQIPLQLVRSLEAHSRRLSGEAQGRGRASDYCALGSWGRGQRVSGRLQGEALGDSGEVKPKDRQVPEKELTSWPQKSWPWQAF